MSAIVCGKRSSFFEEIPSSPVAKRVRCSSSSPVRFSPSQPLSPSSSSLLLDHLVAFFPDMDKKLLERALEECGDDLDAAIKRLNELRLGYPETYSGASAGDSDIPAQANDLPQVTSEEGGGSTNESAAPTNLPVDGAGWVELVVTEMMSATNLEDAKVRAARVLEAFEKSIAQGQQNLLQENMLLKEQLQALVQENSILKRAVSIQHERQKEFEEKERESQQLKQLVSQYQEQLRTLEVNNYALAMHLKQAQQSNSIPGRFNPDVF